MAKKKPKDEELGSDLEYEEYLPQEKIEHLDEKTKDAEPQVKKIVEEGAGAVPRRVVRDFYDETPKRPRKTKKQKKVLEQWQGDNLGRTMDLFLKALVDEGRNQFGHRSIGVASDSDRISIGIPCPFPIEVLIGHSVLPLSCVYLLIGPFAALKTSLVLEIIRWFRNAGGGGVYVENETKLSPDLMPSILGYDQQCCILHRTDSVDGWQDSTTYWTRRLQKECLGTKQNPGPGKTVPFAVAVDSVMAKLSRESQDKIISEGHAGRSHPVEALSITNYMKTYPNFIESWPFALFLVNQLKTHRRQDGTLEKSLAGGEQMKFQAAVAIESKVTKSSIRCAAFEGKQVQLRTYKNSLAPDSRKIDTRMIWFREEDEDGEKRQITRWDWGWATVKLLLSQKGAVKDKIDDILHLQATATGDATNAAWSKTLGIPKDSPLSWSEVGNIIMQDKEVVHGLRDVFNVKDNQVFLGGVTQYEEAQENELRQVNE